MPSLNHSTQKLEPFHSKAEESFHFQLVGVESQEDNVLPTLSGLLLPKANNSRLDRSLCLTFPSSNETSNFMVSYEPMFACSSQRRRITNDVSSTSSLNKKFQGTAGYLRHGLKSVFDYQEPLPFANVHETLALQLDRL